MTEPGASDPVPPPPEPHAHRVPLKPAGSFFVSTLIGAAAVALFAGDAEMMWGYIGAFTVTIALGVGLTVRADQHNRAVDARRRRSR